MSKKISVGVALSLVLASITATFALTMAFSQSIYNKLISNISGRAEMYSTIEDINALIRTNYFYFSSINNENINYSVSQGYIEGLGDTNSRFMTAGAYINYNNRLNGNASGVGITTIWDKNKSQLRVSAVASGSSAAAKGIKTGDILTKIGGEKVTSKNREELTELLSGDTLSTVTVTCMRDKTPLEFNVTVGYSYLSVTQKTIGSVGYIRINAFYANTQEQLKEAIAALQQDNVTAIVFDLRGTSEGTVEYAAAAIDCITPVCSSEDEVLATLVGRDGIAVRSYPSTSNNLNLPMAVLVNAETAGPAELFACDLRDFDKAVLVGTTTAGIGTAQEVFTLEDGSAVLLTTSKILPYKSESFNETGLTPNHEVFLESAETTPELLELNEDMQLQKAIAVLSEE